MSLTSIPFISIGPWGINKDECNDLEKQRLFIPDMKSLDNEKSFRWAYRKLVSFTTNDESHYGDYMMYLCLDEGSGLMHNDFLEELVKVGRGPKHTVDPFKVYGDAFVFRMDIGESESRRSDGYLPARYIHMDDGFIDSATSRRPEVGTWAYDLLCKLLLCPHEKA